MKFFVLLTVIGKQALVERCGDAIRKDDVLKRRDFAFHKTLRTYSVHSVGDQDLEFCIGGKEKEKVINQLVFQEDSGM